MLFNSKDIITIDEKTSRMQVIRYQQFEKQLIKFRSTVPTCWTKIFDKGPWLLGAKKCTREYDAVERHIVFGHEMVKLNLKKLNN